jgi:hypothetical protein
MVQNKPFAYSIKAFCRQGIIAKKERDIVETGNSTYSGNYEAAIRAT